MSSQSRTAAVADLFAALDGLLLSYSALPDEDRERRWSGDADRITGEVARHLGTARTRLASTVVPPAAVRAEAE